MSILYVAPLFRKKGTDYIDEVIKNFGFLYEGKPDDLSQSISKKISPNIFIILILSISVFPPLSVRLGYFAAKNFKHEYFATYNGSEYVLIRKYNDEIILGSHNPSSRDLASYAVVHLPVEFKRIPKNNHKDEK
jgi:hypothetical protein